MDSVGVKSSETMQFLATSLCICILLLYVFSSLTAFDYENIKSGIGGGGSFLNPNNAVGFFKGFPFALQFYDGFEELPLVMGEGGGIGCRWTS